ncbi:hypothetical protein M513_11621, partial [Trichuris suis]
MPITAAENVQGTQKCPVCQSDDLIPWALIEHLSVKHAMYISRLERSLHIPNWGETTETFTGLFCPACSINFHCLPDFHQHLAHIHLRQIFRTPRAGVCVVVCEMRLQTEDSSKFPKSLKLQFRVTGDVHD